MAALEKARSAWRMAGRVYETELKPRIPYARALLLYSKFIHEGDLCFDVGASVGSRTKVMLNLGATVVAVEPHPGSADELERKYAGERRLTVVRKALGARPGEAEMMVCDCSMMSSLSPGWVNSVRESNRFPGREWDSSEQVEVTTLDTLIDEFGVPAFCKVDVEGYEEQVMMGLSRPLNAVSFEFTPEYMTAATGSVRRLASLGNARFNYSEGESMRLALRRWVSAGKMLGILGRYPDARSWGDVYARFG